MPIKDRAVQIVLNGRFLSQQVTGVQRFALSLTQALDKMLSEPNLAGRFEVSMVFPPGGNPKNVRFNNIQGIEVGRFKGHLWEQVELPFIAKGILVNLCNTAPILKKKQIVVIHDAGVYRIPWAYSSIFRNYYKILFSFLKRRSRVIVTVSQFSKEELQFCLKISPEKLQNISEGKEHISEVCADNTENLSGGIPPVGCVLAVSSQNRNKNFGLILRAASALEDQGIKFLIAGGSNARIFRSSREESPSNVEYLGYISDRELKFLYEKSLCFVYPSFYEGFGLPPLEAMGCGCPVIVSDIVPLVELCGEAALYVDPNDPVDLADKIRLLHSDRELRRSLIKKGIERAGMYTWEKSAEELLRIISKSFPAGT